MRTAGRALLLLLVLGLSPAASRADLLDHISYMLADGSRLSGKPGSPIEVGIDNTVSVRWDREGFLADLARTSGIPSLGDSLAPSIDALRVATELLYEAQAKLIALRTTTSRLKRELGPAVHLSETPEFQKANNAFSDVGLKALTALEPYKRSKPILYAAANKSVLGSDYLPLATVVETELHSVGDELARRLQAGQHIQVYMRATLRDETGRSRPIHLDNYDNIVVGEPAPFPRFETSVSERTAGELKAADQLAQIVNGLAKGTVQDEARQALDEIRKAAQDLATKIRSDVLESQLDSLSAEIRASGDATLMPMLVELRDARSWVASLAAVPDLSGKTDAERLISLGNELGRKVTELGHIRAELPARLEALATALDSLAARRAGIVRTDLIATLRSAVTELKSADGAVGKLVGQFQDLAGALSLTTGVSQAAMEASTHPREVGPGQSLDTQFDLMTLDGRHPGDWVFVTTRVVRQDPGSGETVVVSDRRQTFRLEAYGLYMEPRGALLFADPRGKPHGNQSYEATPGLGFHWRVGLKNRAFWNRVLSPGVGVSFALLDFVDNKGLEVGVAGSATFLADLLWVGYGRNLQAQMDYFYLGINPMVVVGLGRGAPVGR